MVIFCYLSTSIYRSSVSKPIFATKYSFFSNLRELQNKYTFAPLQIQNLQFFSIFPFFYVNSLDFCIFFVKFAQIGDFSPKFSRNFIGIAGNVK